MPQPQPQEIAASGEHLEPEGPEPVSRIHRRGFWGGGCQLPGSAQSLEVTPREALLTPLLSSWAIQVVYIQRHPICPTPLEFCKMLVSISGLISPLVAMFLKWNISTEDFSERGLKE